MKRTIKKVSIFFLLFSFVCTTLHSYMEIINRPDPNTITAVVNRVPQDADYICFVDFGKPSAEYRFFVYEKKSKKFIAKHLVQHGIGGGSTARHAVFSNKVGSNCSSLGVYKVLNEDKLHTIRCKCFRLKGLSDTNSNAYRRGIVIHPSITCTMLPCPIPNMCLPLTPESKGCFAVSYSAMETLSEIYKKGKVYLVAYN